MSFNGDGKMDQDEALRLVDLAAEGSSSGDVLMLVESKGSVIEGESDRKFEDGKRRMAVAGYFLASRVQTPPGTSKGRVVNGGLTIVRLTDTSTAPLASLLKSQADDLKVTVSVFKASGDSSPDQQPTMELRLKDARISVLTLLSGGRLGLPCEVIVFDYRSITIASAVQGKSGLRGAESICTFGS